MKMKQEEHVQIATFFFKCCHLEANIEQFVASKSVENSSTNEEQFFVINN